MTDGREAICNAVFHRNYLEPSNIYVALYADRLEIISPGSLLKEITIEEVRRGYSKIRNKGLAEALVYMHEVESWGGGVSRYFSAMEKAGLPPPIAKEQDGFFKVVFWRASKTGTTPKTTSKTTPKTTLKTTPKKDMESSLKGNSLLIYNLIARQPSITVDGLVDSTGLTRNGIKYHIKRLKAIVGLYRAGGRKDGTWEFPVADG